MNGNANPLDPIEPLRLQAKNPTLHCVTPDLSSAVQQVHSANAKAIAEQVTALSKSANLALETSGIKSMVDSATQLSQAMSATIPNFVHQVQSPTMKNLVKSIDQQFFRPRIDYSALFKNTEAVNKAIDSLLSTPSFALNFHNFGVALQEAVDDVSVQNEAPQNQVLSYPDESAKDPAATESPTLSATERAAEAFTALLDQSMESARKTAISFDAASLIAQIVITLAVMGLQAHPVLIITLIWSLEQAIQRLLRSPDELDGAED